MIDQEKVAKKKDVKLRSLIFTGLGGTIGGTIYVIIGQSIRQAGAGVLFSILLLGILVVMLVQNYVELSLSLPILGGGYSFSREAIGGFWGYLIGWLLLLGNMAFSALSGLGFGLSLSIFFPNQQNLATNYLSFVGFGVILILSVLNLIAYKKLQKIMKVFTWILLFGFVIYIILGLSLGPFLNTQNFNPPDILEDVSFTDVIRVSPILFGIFCLYEWNSAFESITASIDQIRQPGKKIPRAFLISILIGLCIYFLVSLTTIINMGETGGSVWEKITQSNNPLAETLNTVIGPIGLYLIGFAGMISTMTSAQAAIQLSYRISYAMARDGYLPSRFAEMKIHHPSNIPRITILTSCLFILISTLFFNSSNINILIDFSNFSIILSMCLLSFSVIILRRKRPNLKRQFKAKFYPILPLLTGVICLILVIFIAPNGLAIGILMTLFGVVIYGLKLAKRERVLLMLSGTKLAAVILTVTIIIFTKNDFVMLEGFFLQFIEKLDGIPIVIICFFSLISIVLDIKPLDTIIQQRTKKLDSNAQVVSEIVELGRGKREVIYRFNIVLGSFLFLMAAVMFLYSFLLWNKTLFLEDKFFHTANMQEIALVVFTLFGIVLCINGFKRIYLELESRKIKI
ncbi:MAG: APC family permease [Candidatus Lokiarchaeota archaeon]|nr:APC family permease [Candidatus Lokiarchaeota archaeon]